MPRQQTPGEVGPGPFVESSLGEKQYVNPLTHAACRLALLLHGNLVAQAQGNALCLGTDAHKPLDVAIRLLLNAGKTTQQCANTSNRCFYNYRQGGK